MSKQIDVSSAHTYLHIAETNDDYISLHPDDLAAIARTIITQSGQIDEVCEVRSFINQLITYSGEAISMDGMTLAKSIVNKLNDALGDTDD